MNMPRIMVVGSANIDLVTRVPRIPRPGESVIGHSFATVTGGKGANQAVAAGRLGAAVRFVGCVGQDGCGDLQRQSLRAAQVDVTYLQVHPSEPTGTAVILVSDEGQNSIVVTPSANFGLMPGDIEALEPVFRQTDVVLLQLEVPLETVEAALELARRCGVLSILDAGPAQRVPASLVSKADVVSPNETEAEAMTGIAVNSLEGAREAAACFLQMGARHAVMKLGANGSLYVGDGEVYAPPFPVTPVDTTAAGDAFTAALGVAWGRLPIQETLRFANATGALATTIAGAQPSMPTRAAVETFLQQPT
jgi:ribokinase